jgi:valyl-tRNA synthetase
LKKDIRGTNGTKRGTKRIERQKKETKNEFGQRDKKVQKGQKRQKMQGQKRQKYWEKGTKRKKSIISQIRKIQVHVQWVNSDRTIESALKSVLEINC